MITFHIDRPVKKTPAVFGWICQAIKRRKLRKLREEARQRIEMHRQFRQEVREMFHNAR